VLLAEGKLLFSMQEQVELLEANLTSINSIFGC